jgi:hypothetical protein
VLLYVQNDAFTHLRTGIFILGGVMLMEIVLNIGCGITQPRVNPQIAAMINIAGNQFIHLLSRHNLTFRHT